jgi:hypothetical protein
MNIEFGLLANHNTRLIISTERAILNINSIQISIVNSFQKLSGIR